MEYVVSAAARSPFPVNTFVITQERIFVAALLVPAAATMQRMPTFDLHGKQALNGTVAPVSKTAIYQQFQERYYFLRISMKTPAAVRTVPMITK